MCGIYGWISATPSKENLEIFLRLGEASMERGTDATGACFFDVKKKKYWLGKNDVNALKFHQEVLSSQKEALIASPLCIGHTRAWSVGRPEDNNNNHPLYSEDWILIHNGTCALTAEIRNYKYMGEVDSERLLAQIQMHGFKGLENCSGASAIALLPRKSKKRELYLYRMGMPLYLAYKKDNPTIYFGSTQEIAQQGSPSLLGFFCEHYVQELPENQVWKVWIEKGEPRLKVIERVEYGLRLPYHSRTSYLADHCLWDDDHDVNPYTPNTDNKRVTTYYYCKHCSSSFTSMVQKMDHERICIRNPNREERKLLPPTSSDMNLPADWRRYWNIEKKCWEDIAEFGWKYDAKAAVFIHPTVRLVRWYDVDMEKLVVASPEYAVKLKRIDEVPESYRSNPPKGKSNEK